MGEQAVLYQPGPYRNYDAINIMSDLSSDDAFSVKRTSGPRRNVSRTKSVDFMGSGGPSSLSVPVTRSGSHDPSRAKKPGRHHKPVLRAVSRSRSVHNIPAPRHGVTRSLSHSAPAGSYQKDSVGESARRDSDGDSYEAPASLCAASNHQKFTLLCLALGDILSFMGFSLMAPFFPKEASERGVSTSTSGWIFGIFSLVQFISSPIFGKFLPQLGPKFTFIMGAFVCGICTILFGFLDGYPRDNELLFTIFCFVIRGVLALGATAWSTATFAIATYMFSETPTTVMGILETSIGVGLMVGPAVGGVLYEVGGFKLPFIVVGVLTLLTIPVYYFILDSDFDEDSDDDESEEGDSSMSIMFDILRIPAVACVLGSVFLAAFLWIVLDPTLEPHLRVFNMSASQVGLVFLLLSACYAVASPIIGYVADKMEDSTPLMIVGYVLLTFVFIFLGPSSLIGLQDYNEVWLNLVCVSVLGVAMGFACIPTYDKVLYAAEKAGIEESMQMHGAVAGLWNSVYALGETFGPITGAWLVEKYDFSWAMTVCAFISLFTMCMLIILWFSERFCACCKSRSIEDERKLLASIEA